MKKSGVPLTIKDYFQSHENAGLKQASKGIIREWMRLLALGGDKTRMLPLRQQLSMETC